MISSSMKCVQQIKLKVRLMPLDCILPYVHRFKIARFVTMVLRLTESLELPKDDSCIISQDEEVLYRIIENQLDRLNNLINKYYENDYINTLLDSENVNYALDEIYEIQKELNDAFGELGFYNQEGVLPLEINKDEMNIDNFRDIKNIIYKLENTCVEDNRKQKKTDLMKKLEAMLKEIEGSIDFNKFNAEQDNIMKKLNEFNEWNIETREFTQINRIIHDEISETYEGLRVSNQQDLVMIDVYDTKLFDNEIVEVIKNEISFMVALKHFSILNFIGYSIGNGSFKVYYDLMTRGLLYNIIHSNGILLSSTSKTIIALGVAYGMKNIHDNGFIHRNLNSKSIYIDADYFPRIGNFKYVTKVDNKTNEKKGFDSWTAPEMIYSSNYGQKVDIYSYGILLWEIFTQYVPFQGSFPLDLLNEVSNNKRPLVPQTCPPKLSMLISNCWDNDPEKRPSFTEIIDIIENNEIFPGTDFELIESYKNIVFKNSEIDDIKEEVNEQFEQSVSQFQTDNNNFDEIMKFTSKNLTNENLTKFITSPKFLKCFLSYVENSNSSNLDIIMNFLHNLFLYHGEFVEIFENSNITELLMKLFMRYGTTKIKFFLEILHEVIHISKYLFNSNNFLKISSFLLSDNVSLRQQVISILAFIVETKMYDQPSSLVVIIPNLLVNLNSKIKQNLLVSSLNFLDLLSTFEELFPFFKNPDIILSILSLCLHQNPHISSHAFDFIKQILKQTKPNEKFINSFINLFEKFEASPSVQITLQPLIIISLLMNEPIFFKRFANSSRAIDMFGNYLSIPDPTIIIYALRLSFSFISNEQTSRQFAKHLPIFISLLKYDKESISSLSASCITRLIPVIPQNISQILVSDIIQYIKKSFSSCDEIINSALRLVGSISSTKLGIEFLKENDCIQLIVPFINSDNDETQKLSIMIFTSLSLYLQSDIFISIVPCLFNLIQKEELQSYIFRFIGNISDDAEAAKICVPYLNKLFDMIEVDTKRVFIASKRIILTQEVISILNEEDIELIFKTFIDYLISEKYTTIVLEIFNALSTSSIGKTVLNRNNLKSLIDNYFQTIPSFQLQYFLFQRISSRLSK